MNAKSESYNRSTELFKIKELYRTPARTVNVQVTQAPAACILIYPTFTLALAETFDIARQ
jgi:hypothetical protein